jgi:hypothetical protein
LENNESVRQLEEIKLEEEKGADALTFPLSTHANGKDEAPLSPRIPPAASSCNGGSARRPRAGSAAVASPDLDQAIEFYNDEARRYGWVVCQARALARLARLQKRLADIGGFAAWQKALTAITCNDWMMGRIPPKDGRKPFKFDIEYLLQTDGKSGAGLAKLVDAAATEPTCNGDGSDWSPAAMKPAAWRAKRHDWPLAAEPRVATGQPGPSSPA